MSIWSRIRNLIRGDLNDDLDAELQSHFDEAQAAGRDALEVRRAFACRLGVRDTARDMIVAVWLESLLVDLRQNSTGYTQNNPAAQNDWTLFPWEAYQRFGADTPAFEELAAFQIGTGNGELAVRRAGSAAAVQARLGEYVSGNFFRMFGISAWRGRFFTDADDVEAAPPVAVTSFHTWQESSGRARSACASHLARTAPRS